MSNGSSLRLAGVSGYARGSAQTVRDQRSCLTVKGSFVSVNVPKKGSKKRLNELISTGIKCQQQRISSRCYASVLETRICGTLTKWPVGPSACGAANAVKCDLCLINLPGDGQEKSAAGSASTRPTPSAPVSAPAAATFAKKHENKLLAISAVPMGTGRPRARPRRR